MSIISNIQGTLTQAHQVQHLNQQALDKTNVQQQFGEVQNEVEHEEKRHSINEQENANLAQMDKDGTNKDQRKRHPKKKILADQEQPNANKEWRVGLGGGLIDTQA